MLQELCWITRNYVLLLQSHLQRSALGTSETTVRNLQTVFPLYSWFPANYKLVYILCQQLFGPSYQKSLHSYPLWAVANPVVQWEVEIYGKGRRLYSNNFSPRYILIKSLTSEMGLFSLDSWCFLCLLDYLKSFFESQSRLVILKFFASDCNIWWSDLIQSGCKHSLPLWFGFLQFSFL